VDGIALMLYVVIIVGTNPILEVEVVLKKTGKIGHMPVLIAGTNVVSH
jgi:hypothetical protein